MGRKIEGVEEKEFGIKLTLRAKDNKELAQKIRRVVEKLSKELNQALTIKMTQAGISKGEHYKEFFIVNEIANYLETSVVDAVYLASVYEFDELVEFFKKYQEIENEEITIGDHVIEYVSGKGEDGELILITKNLPFLSFPNLESFLQHVKVDVEEMNYEKEKTLAKIKHLSIKITNAMDNMIIKKLEEEHPKWLKKHFELIKNAVLSIDPQAETPTPH